MKLNYIYNENCLDTMAKMPDGFVDLTVTSPPYDNLRDYKGYSFDFESIAKELFRITAVGGVVVWVVGDQTVEGSETGTSFRQALYLKEVGFRLHDTMIYDKGKVVFPDANRYHNCWEYMFVFSKERPKTTNLIADRKNKHLTERKQSSFRQKDGTIKQKEVKPTPEIGIRYNIWQYPNGFMQSSADKIAFEHPAIFPEKLAHDHIVSWSKEGDIVYDPFMGSGTTAKMAKLLKRNYIGSEISKEYCDIAQARLDATTQLLF